MSEGRCSRRRPGGATSARLAAGGALWALLVTTGAAFAQSGTVVVLPASGSNVSEVIIYQARALLVQGLARVERRVRVVDLDRAPRATPLELETAVNLGRSLQGNAVLFLNVARDAASTTITVTTHSTRDGSQTSLVSEVTTAGPEALPGMIDRII